jgi:hypothetical protein
MGDLFGDVFSIRCWINTAFAAAATAKGTWLIGQLPVLQGLLTRYVVPVTERWTPASARTSSRSGGKVRGQTPPPRQSLASPEERSARLRATAMILTQALIRDFPVCPTAGDGDCGAGSDPRKSRFDPGDHHRVGSSF